MAGKKKKADRERRRKREKTGKLRLADRDPHDRIAAAGEVVECCINAGWDTSDMASIIIVRKTPVGDLAIAGFLIDFLCLGLKDAWGRLDLTPAEYQSMLRRAAEHGEPMVDIDIEEARRLIAASIRFARQNGFRLPRRYDRWTSLVGGVGDIDSADLSLFGDGDGTLIYMGSPGDLRRRLIGQSVEQFLARDDVECDFGYGEPMPFDEDEEDFEQMIDETRDAMLNTAKKWCFAHGVKPHPRLAEACEMNVIAALHVESQEDGGPTIEEIERSPNHLETMLEMCDPDERAEMREAIEQLRQCVSDFQSEEEMVDAVQSESSLRLED